MSQMSYLILPALQSAVSLVNMEPMTGIEPRIQLGKSCLRFQVHRRGWSPLRRLAFLAAPADEASKRQRRRDGREDINST